MTRARSSNAMRDREHVEQIKAALSDPYDVARRLRLLDGARRQARGLHVRCPAHDDSGPSCSLTQGHDGTLRAVCFGNGCDLSGDVFCLIAAVERLDVRRDFALVLRRAAELSGVEIDRRPRRPPSRAPAPKAPPPVSEVRALWSACGSCATDADVAAWLRSRAIDPALVDRLNLARALPVGFTGLRWASYRGEADAPAPWAVLGYRVIVPMYDAAGEVRSVRARYIGPPRDELPKALPPSGHGCKGLVMACPAAALMLAVSGWPWWAARRVVITEGEPDFLTWATRGEIPRRLAVIGLGGSGQWTEALADRIPDDSVVTIRTDPDDAGDAYVSEIVASLRGRCRTRESDPDGRAQRRRAKAERDAARRTRQVQPAIPGMVR
jgi:hypothetical protein